MGVNTHQDDYYESLFRRTTASFRAKHNKENAPKNPERTTYHLNEDIRPTTSRATQARQRILHERNRQADDTTTTTDTSLEVRHPKSPKKTTQNPIKAHGTGNTSLKGIVEDLVAQILQEKFSNTQGTKHEAKVVLGAASQLTYMDAATMKSVVHDLVNKILNDKLSGQREFQEGPLKSTIEDIVNEKLKEQLAKLPQNSASGGNKDNHDSKLNRSKDKPQQTSKTLDSQALMAELLSKDDLKSQNKQRSTKGRCPTPEWEQLSEATTIKRLPRSQVKRPEWQEAANKNKVRSTSAGRARSPSASTSGHSSRNHNDRGNGVLIPRSDSQGRARKPNNSDPVALYQYYKSEWDHFRKQIPGENNHNRLRWHVRQRLLDPE